MHSEFGGRGLAGREAAIELNTFDGEMSLGFVPYSKDPSILGSILGSP